MKVCFVGLGSIAKRHIRNLSQLCSESNVELTVDALRHPQNGSCDSPEYITNTYYSADCLPQDYDVIFLTNPTQFHAESLIRLHDHARHFFIEKPVTSIDTIDSLSRLTLRPDSVYYVACPLRYSNVIQYIKREVDPQKVISVRSISSSYLPDWRPGTDYRSTYSAHKDLGGGVAIDLIHEWDYLSYLFGMPTELKSYIGKVSNLEIDSCDYAIYIARYSNNMIAELHLDYFGRKTLRSVELFTDDDTIVGDLVSEEVRYLKSGKVVNLKAERDVYHQRELRHFFDAVSGKADVQNGIVDAVKVLKLTQGIIE